MQLYFPSFAYCNIHFVDIRFEENICKFIVLFFSAAIYLLVFFFLILFETSIYI